MNIIQERLAKLRALMAERGMAAYLIPTDDFHGSEYVGEYFKCRKYISGFTGSAATVVVMADKAGLWTDGRYFLQAAMELEGSGIDLYKSGQPGVPTIEQFLYENLQKGDVLGFDGRTIIGNKAESLTEALSRKKIKFSYKEDLVGMIWENRPPLPTGKAWLLPVEYAGKSREEKLADVRKILADDEIDALVLTSLDDIAWLFNIRGSDVECNPVVMAYSVITADEVKLFADPDKFSPEDRAELAAAGIEILPYNDIYEYVETLGYAPEASCGNCGGTGEEDDDAVYAVLIDGEKANYALINNIPENTKIVYGENPTLLPKAVKNEVEIENMRKTHIKDGVATTRLIYWLKHRDKNTILTELDVSAKIEEFRSEQEGYMGPSFESIAASGSNGAIIHYFPNKQSNTAVSDRGFFLLDTGGQYMGGTTDITRTIAVGPLTDEEKLHYTAVLRGNLALSAVKFPEGLRGINLDILARKPLWDIGCDFNHGTGHGVGYMLNVHEGPNSIRNKIDSYLTDSSIFRAGMITSNEPGVYIEGKHGIRLETLILCKNAGENPQMLEFETLTLVPFDLDAIEPKYMTDEEKHILNAYHKRVYETIAPYLPEEEAAWLAEATREVETERYKFNQHRECEFFPCHAGADKENFNCLFCYCPLYALGDKCGGNFKYLENGIKDCSACMIPHTRAGYDYVMGKYGEIAELAAKNRQG